MNRFAYIALAAVPAMVAPAAAQEETLTVSDYIQAQLALLGGVTELLNMPTVAQDPADTAKGVQQLAQYAAALASLKSQLNADDLAAAQGALESDPSAQIIGAGFIAAVNKLADNNFYNSSELATAVQQFVAALAQM